MMAAMPTVMRSASNAPMPFRYSRGLINNRVPPARMRPSAGPSAVVQGSTTSRGEIRSPSAFLPPIGTFPGGGGGPARIRSSPGSDALSPPPRTPRRRGRSARRGAGERDERAIDHAGISPVSGDRGRVSTLRARPCTLPDGAITGIGPGGRIRETHRYG